MSKPATPFGYSLFCDDIRHEMGNKTSLIGIYQGVLAFEAVEFPLTLPKLCIVITWHQDTEDEVRPVKLKVFYELEGGEDQLVLEGELAVEGFNKATKITPDASKLTAQAHAVLSPLTLEGVGSLKVRAYYGEDEYRIGRLHVIRGPIHVVPAES